MLQTNNSLYGPETLKLRIIGQEYLERTVMSCWRRMEKSVGLIVCKMKSRGRNEHPTYSNMKKDNWIGYILRTSCLPKRIIKRMIEGKRDGTRKQEGRRKQLLNDINPLQTKRGLLYLKTQSVPRSKHSISVMKINQFIL